MKSPEAENITRDLKNLITYLPLFGAYFIFYGAINLITYYSQFNIPIIQYINISEIISYFVKDIILISILYIIVISAYFVYSYWDRKYSKKQNEKLDNYLRNIDKEIDDFQLPTKKEELEEQRSRAEKIKQSIVTAKEASDSFYSRQRLWLLIIAMIVIIAIGYFTYISGWLYGLQLILSCLVSASIASFTRNLKLLLVILALIIPLITAFFSALRSAQQVLQQNKGIVIEFTDKRYNSANNIYLGKTEDYIFVYNEDSQSSTVLSVDKIESIQFPSNPVY